MANHSTGRSKLGSVSQMPNGKWRVRVSSGFKRDGKRRWKTKVVDTEKEAEQLRAQFAIELGEMPNLGDDMTLSDYYYNLFVPACKARGLTNATIKSYDGTFKRVLEPAFGHRGMSTIKHAEIQALVYTLTHYQAKHAAATLRAILRSAWDDELLDVEPMRHRLRFPRNERPQRGVWSAQDVAAAMPVMEGSPIETLWLCMIGAGLRREEAYALFWGDLTFEEVTSITGQVEYLCTAVIDDAVTLADGRKSVKTAFSERVVIVSEPFASRLHALRQGPEEPICTVGLGNIDRSWRKMWEERPKRKDGTPYAAGNPSYFKGKMLEAGIPYIQLSRMRATHETIIQSAGIADTLNARLHGRSSTSGVGYTNYLNPDVAAFAPAARAVSDKIKGAQGA